MGILVNKNRVKQAIYENVFEKWATEFKKDGGGHDAFDYRVRKEKSSITKEGKLQIGWPKSVDPKEKSKIEELDFLMASSTKPTHKDGGNTKYPSPDEIAHSVTKDSCRRYFLKNFQNTITTFQDNDVINLL